MFNESGTAPALSAGASIPCPACGVEIPLVQRGRLTVARHACLGLPERDVYEENPPEQAAAVAGSLAEEPKP